MFLTTLIGLGLTQAAEQNRGVVPPNRWTVDYGQVSCSLARRVGGEGSAIVVMHASLGMEPGQLLIMDGGTGLDSRLTGELEVRLDEGDPLVVRGRAEQRSGHAVVSLVRVPTDFLERVAAARRLIVGKAGQAVLTLSLDDAHEAVEALGRCNDDLHQSWGIDVAARRALSRKPSVTNYEWAFEVAPYSDAYIAFVANISERGRPRDCRVVVTTGNRRMDETVCRLFRARARLEPALDAQGRPVAAQYITAVRFSVRE